jgi:hypothetical protein
MGWSAKFDPAILLPDGCKLVTLRDAGGYMAALPSATQIWPEWQTAAQVLLLVAEHGGPTMLARIGMMRALNAGKSPPEPPQKSAKSFRILR